jgi:hypothetical protein
LAFKMLLTQSPKQYYRKKRDITIWQNEFYGHTDQSPKLVKHVAYSLFCYDVRVYSYKIWYLKCCLLPKKQLKPWFGRSRICLGTRCKSRFKKIKFFFLLKFNMICTFWIVLMCWCQNWFLKNKKNINDMHFSTKNYLNNRYHTAKHPCRLVKQY